MFARQKNHQALESVARIRALLRVRAPRKTYMALHSDVTQLVSRAPDGPQIGAFFDFDGTLMAGFSATEFLKEQIKRGGVSVSDLVETFATIGSFSLGNIGFSGLMTASARLLRGVTEASYYEFGEEVYEKQIAALIYPEARALVRAHLDKGHTVAIVSSATPSVSRASRICPARASSSAMLAA